MIVNRHIVDRFELELLKGEKADHRRNLRILAGMWREAVLLGALPPRDPLEGIEVEERIARVVNSV